MYDMFSFFGDFLFREQIFEARKAGFHRYRRRRERRWPGRANGGTSRRFLFSDRFRVFFDCVELRGKWKIQFIFSDYLFLPLDLYVAKGAPVPPVKREDYRALTEKVVETNRIARSGRKSEIGSFLSDLQPGADFLLKNFFEVPLNGFVVISREFRVV